MSSQYFTPVRQILDQGLREGLNLKSQEKNSKSEQSPQFMKKDSSLKRA